MFSMTLKQIQWDHIVNIISACVLFGIHFYCLLWLLIVLQQLIVLCSLSLCLCYHSESMRE